MRCAPGRPSLTEPLTTPKQRKRAAQGARAVSSGGARAGRRAGRIFSASPSSLAAAEAVTTGALVAYDLMGASDKKLPRPGPIVAAVGFYAMLSFAAAASATLAPAVTAAGWVLALSVLVTGRRGEGIVRLLGSMARLAAKTGQGQTQSGGGQ